MASTTRTKIVNSKPRRSIFDDDGLSPMTIVEHLEELRWRLLKVVIAVVIGTIVAFVFRDYIIDFLQAPMPETANQLGMTDDKKLVVMGLTEGFTVYLFVSLAVGVVIALPVLLYQIWAFIAPALYEHERKNAIPFILMGLVLFVIGIGLGYLALRYPIQFLLNLSAESFTTMITADSYFKFVAIILLIFGLVFEMPLILTFLARVGIVSRETLQAKRPYVHFVMWVLAAFTTPGGDIYSPLMLGGSMSILYEISIFVIRFTVKPSVDDEEELETT